MVNMDVTLEELYSGNFVEVRTMFHCAIPYQYQSSMFMDLLLISDCTDFDMSIESGFENRDLISVVGHKI